MKLFGFLLLLLLFFIKINVLRGSCVNIPCSFDLDNTYDKNLDNSCKAYWSDSSSFDSENAKLKPTKEMTGDLTKKDCTTTFNNASYLQSAKYYFRLEYFFFIHLLTIHEQITLNVFPTDDPPSPTLTPSTLEVEEGASVSLTCSAPAPCWSHPPALTWSSNLGQSQETLQENQDKTKVRTSVMNFNASHLHHGNKISCTAVYQKQDGSPDVTAETSLTPDISYSPKDVQISISPSAPILENQKVTLTCSSNANPAVENYTWYRADGDLETFIGTGSSFNVTVSKVKSTFFCKATNELGFKRSSNLQINYWLLKLGIPDSHIVRHIVRRTKKNSNFLQIALNLSSINQLKLNTEEKVISFDMNRVFRKKSQEKQLVIFTLQFLLKMKPLYWCGLLSAFRGTILCFALKSI
uniref:Ig-like domain-containing protein n=1 Tax=Astatotilapia calliptera TaxID=8154 RepID=A0AAX7UIP7_ASTCA